MTRKDLQDEIRKIVDLLEFNSLHMSDSEREAYEDDLRALRNRLNNWFDPIYRNEKTDLFHDD